MIMTFMVGWWAPDFLSSLAERMNSKEEKPRPST